MVNELLSYEEKWILHDVGKGLGPAIREKRRKNVLFFRRTKKVPTAIKLEVGGG